MASEEESGRHRRRVVVTGMGAVTPLGNDVESSWESAITGVSGISEIDLFDAETFSCRIAGQVREFDFGVESEDFDRLNRGAQFGLMAASSAVSSAGRSWPDRYRIGVSMGCGRSGPDLNAIAHFLNERRDEAAEILGAAPIRERSFESGADAIARLLDAGGPNYSIYTACSAATQAIGQAFRNIQRGDADVIIAGGYDSMVNEMSIIGFTLLRVLSTNNSNPRAACRPFDRDRDGLVLGEGAAVLVLEELGAAKARGANMLAEVSGYGSSMNAFRITDPDPEADGPTQAMLAALRDAGLSPSQIDYVNAHGTATWSNDPLETLAVKRVFGDRAYEVPISSTKSMTGHLMAAAGAVESVFSVLTIVNGTAPPTINLEHPDRRCDLDYVACHARRMEVEHVMNNSFAFGGINATLIFSRFRE